LPPGLDQLLDLGRSQIFARAQIGIGLLGRHGPRTGDREDRHRVNGNNLGRGNLPVFVTWPDHFQARDHW
jgi:hypothetical protein